MAETRKKAAARKGVAKKTASAKKAGSAKKATRKRSTRVQDDDAARRGAADAMAARMDNLRGRGLVTRVPWAGERVSPSERGGARASGATGPPTSRIAATRAPVDRRESPEVFTVDVTLRDPKSGNVLLILRRPFGFPSGPLPGDPGSFAPCSTLRVGSAMRSHRGPHSGAPSVAGTGERLTTLTARLPLDLKVPGPSRRAVIRATFNAAAPHFDGDPLFFWDAVGQRTVELAGIEPGSRVLDVCCGTGASALPAAERVGPGGSVVGVDLADRLLARGRAKAHRRGFRNIDFVAGDMEGLDVPDACMDTVLCVLGLYYALDHRRALAELWRVVKPGGVLAVTVWGRRSLEPGQSLFLEAVDAVRPDLVATAAGPEQRLGDPGLLRDTFRAAGAQRLRIVEEELVRPCAPSDFWSIVIGSGYRVSLDAMHGADVARVRLGLRQRLEEQGVEAVTSDVLYAAARK